MIIAIIVRVHRKSACEENIWKSTKIRYKHTMSHKRSELSFVCNFVKTLTDSDAVLTIRF